MSSANLSSFIWSVADLLRGDYKQSEYGKVNIGQGAILELIIATPPIAEQKAIAPYCRMVMDSLASLSAEARRAIDLLQERRTALISAAVTGQIDARGAATWNH